MDKSGKELHWSLKFLEEKLSEYGTDPITLGYPINLSRGVKIDKISYNDISKLKF